VKAGMDSTAGYHKYFADPRNGKSANNYRFWTEERLIPQDLSFPVEYVGLGLSLKHRQVKGNSRTRFRRAFRSK
jgi:hypothetical protein